MAREDLRIAYSDLAKQPNDGNTREIEWAVLDKFVTLSKEEEILAKQKSRLNWVKKGDKNTSFFFKSINSHNNRNKINLIRRHNVVEDREVTGIKEALIDQC